MRRAGYKTDTALAKELHIWPSNIKRWRDGFSTPQGDHLTDLCRVLGVSAAYLFGREDPGLHRAVIDEVRRVFGRTEADVLDALRRLTPHHRAIIAGRIFGWVDALEEMERHGEKPGPVTPYDIDRARNGDINGDGEAAGGTPAAGAARR